MLLFNMGSGHSLRAVGDSKRPLYYLMLCCLLNIVLDLVFVAGLHFGVRGGRGHRHLPLQPGQRPAHPDTAGQGQGELPLPAQADKKKIHISPRPSH
ncbi:MAG: hypothetical protein ACLUNZ_07225 [Evtepia sp.]